jgi:DHA3 family macrolide efflux protein-like MFS transporter
VTTASSPGARTPFSARVGAFLAAEALSAIGTWATMVAIWGYAAYKYDATAGDLGLFGLAFSGPAILLGPISGTVVDRIGPKATLAISKAIGIAAALLLLAAHDFRSLALLSALNGVTLAFLQPALQALPPRIVDDEHLARTNAMVGLTDQLAIVLGPVAAGVSIGAFGFKGAFVFDAVTYALGIVALPLVQLRPATTGDGDAVAPARLRDTFEGWRLIARSGVLRRTVTSTFAVHLLYGAALLSEPLYVRDVLHRSPTTFASLQTVFGIFLVIGGLVAARQGDRMTTFGWVVAGVLFSAITSVIYLGSHLLVVAFLGVILWGLATALIFGPSRTVLQRSSPEAAHGRVLSADLVAGTTGEVLGLGVAAGFVALWGVPWSALTFGLGVGAGAIALWLADRRDVSTVPADGDVAEPLGQLAVRGMAD